MELFSAVTPMFDSLQIDRLSGRLIRNMDPGSWSMSGLCRGGKKHMPSAGVIDGPRISENQNRSIFLGCIVAGKSTPSSGKHTLAARVIP